MFSVEKATEFYVGFLGFSVDFEHRFDDAAPLYTQVSRGGLLVHLSEHHGDCCPGSAVIAYVDDLDAYHAEVTRKGYGFMRPGLENMPWGVRWMSVTDPFGNRIHFSDRPKPNE
jgi:uncharacterized glyoxalase superfamily protein PhnB